MNFGYFVKSKNLYPEFEHNVTQGWHMGANTIMPKWDTSQSYYFSDFIPMPESRKIVINKNVRGFAFYTDKKISEYTYNAVSGEVETEGIYLGYDNNKYTKETIRDFSSVFPLAKYIRLWLYPADATSIDTNGLYVGDAENYDPTFSEHYFEPYWVSSDKIALKSDLKNNNFNTIKEDINIKNSDRIGLIGDSYSESHYSVRGKSYINKLSLFSDYVFENYAVSGDIYYGRIDKIRNNISKYGTTFEESRPKYVMMNCYTNDIKTLTNNEYGNALRRACEQVIGEGAQPIICTEYHSGNSDQNQIISLNHQIAREYDCLNWDISPIVSLIRGNDYTPFWGGSHPGTRPNAIESDNYEKFLQGLERPHKSLKVFRCRDKYLNDNIDDLMFWTNEERAEKFLEIYCGHTYITNASEVDNCTTSAQTNEQSEYAKLIRKENVPLPKIALASCVLPSTIGNTQAVSLQIDTDNDVNIYVKNINAGTYVRPTRVLRFDYTNAFTTAPTVGAKYTDPSITAGSSLVTMTVVSVIPGEGEGLGIIYMSGSFGNNNYNNLGGTLTKVSGTGDNSIDYSYKSIGYKDLEDITLGGWTELSYDEENKNYPISTEILKYCIQRDKIDFLITSSNGCNLKDINIVWEGVPSKAYIRKDIDIISNYDNPNTELITSPTMGTANEYNSYWKITPTEAIDNCYPLDTSSLYVINQENKLSTVIAASALGATTQGRKGTYILEVWARYFPPIYSDGTGEQITVDSYDYATLKANIGIGTERNAVTLKERVNLHWKMIQLPIEISFGGSMHIDLFSDKDLQIAYVSLKKK